MALMEGVLLERVLKRGAWKNERTFCEWYYKKSSHKWKPPNPEPSFEVALRANLL